MAEPTKPGQGVIVRADFGGGIDQSADAWKVPPNQLSELVNGRLEKVGSVRKRTGYQAAPEPSASNAFTIFSNVLAGSAITFDTPFPFPVPTTGGVIEAGRPIVVGSKIVFIALMSVPTTPASTLYYFVTYDPYANSCVGQPIGNTEITDVFDTSNIHTDGVNTVWTREKSNIYKYTVSTNTLTSFNAGAALEGWASAIGTPIVDGYMYAIDNVGSIGLGRMYKTNLATEVTTTVGTDRKDTKKLLGHIVRAGEKRLLTVHLNNAQWTDGYGNNALVELSLVDRSVLYTFGAIPTGYLTGPNGDDRNLEDRCVWVDSAERAYLTLNGYAYMINYADPLTPLIDITATLSAVPGFVTGAGFPITTATWGNVAGRQVGGGLSVTYDATNNVVWYASCPVSGSTFPTVVVGLDGDTGVVVQEVRYSPATPIMGLAEIDPVYRIGTGRVQASPTSAITQTDVWGPQTIISQDDPEPGNPVAAASSSKQTVVVDSTRDWSPVSEANDRWAHLTTTDSKIGAESGYVARNHTPTTTVSNYWTSTGPASDVIGDVRILDGNAGNICECVDYGAADNFLFVVKASRAINATSSVAITVSQYDARTGTVVDEHVQTFSTARVYPKMMVFPSLNRILVAVANYSQLSGANTGTVEFLWYQYTDAGLTYSGVLTSDVWRDTIDYFNINLFQGVPEEKYRPAVPFDVAKTGDTTVHFTSYYTGGGAGALRTVGYTVSASGVTFASVGTMAPAGGNPIQALSIEYGQFVNGITGTLIMTAFAAQFNAAVWPYYVGADYQLHVGTFRLDSSANLNYVVRTVLRQSGATPIPGRLTVLQHKISPPDAAPNYGLALGYVEVYEASGAGLQAAAHTMFIVHGSGSAFTVERRSYAIPVARAFELTYYDRVTDGTSTISQARLPLVIGASQQSIYGLNAAVATQPPTTNYGGNYSATIGTQVLVGAREMTLSCVNSPFQTYAPKLQPCPPPRSIVQADGRYGVPHLVAIDGAAGFAIALVTLRSREAGDAQPSSFADMPIFPAGIVQQSDGERFAEVALVDRPVIHQIVASNAGTAWQMTPGDYLVQAIAAYRDSAGNVHRSTPSDPFRWVQATAPNTGRTLSITFSYQSYTNRNDVQIEFYCTEPNGTVLRYWFSAPNVIGLDINVATIHDPSFSTTAPQIGAIGLPALDAPTLYTTGGVLPNVPIPSARFATLYKNRMIVGGSDDPKSIYYSNGPQAYQAASFAVGNVIRMEHEGGCTAAGALNDKLILFSANGIYATFGQFRDSTGAGDALAELESIHDYIGCTQPISVVSIPVGLLFFATDSRFYMIDERLGLNPVGLRVQEITQAGLNVVQCAVHIEQEREVRFYVTNADENDSRVFVYNYQVDQWSTDRILADIDSTPVPITSWGGACISPQLACFVPNPQKWVYDNRTTYKDGPYWIPLSASTAWIQPAGTQEYARFRYAQLLGRSISDHNLGVAVYCDFDEATIRALNIWTPSQLAPITDTVWPEQVRLQVGTQKTQAIKIVISDLEPIGATTGQGPQFVGLALEVLPLGGMRRLPAVRKA